MTKELIERIRTQMIKNPASDLWNKDRNKWTAKEDKEFELMEQGLKKPRNKKLSGGVPVKVIRLSDGYIYKSVRECIYDNGYHSVEMQQMLKDETKYKRCEN